MSLSDDVKRAHAFPGASLTLGAVRSDGQVDPSAAVRIPLGMLNRHGLIAGATGTGKTKTLQSLAEELSLAGVPVFLADVKGDAAGLAAPGDAAGKAADRAKTLGLEFKAQGFPVEFLRLTDGPGVRLRATVTEFGPALLAKVLRLNDTQESVLSLVFKFCDDKGMPLVDLEDLKAVLNHLAGDGAASIREQYGRISTASVGAMLRSMVELERQGAAALFGEPSFDVQDLLRTDPSGRGMVSILELADMQDRPALFSTFMLSLLAELYFTLPEVGDAEKPRLVFFLDEAHLLFDESNRTLREQIEKVIRLIRSKGVGVFFVTQSPKDLSPEVLGQLGHRIQHALRAFTPDDAKDLKAIAGTYPASPHFDVAKLLPALGIGEALVTVLGPDGVPTTPAPTMIRPPRSRMGPLTPQEFADAGSRSPLAGRYGKAVDRESAREILAKRVEGGDEAEPIAGPGAHSGPGLGEILARTATSSAGRAIGREIVRGIFGMLGAGPRRRRSGW